MDREALGKHCITPNMHMHCHLYDCILDYGPLHGFWCFAFERYNGMLGSMPNNSRSIEIQLMHRFLRENQVLSASFPLEFADALMPLFPNVHEIGSFADTLAPEVDISDVQSWTLESLASIIQLPKHSSRLLLDGVERVCLSKLYCDLYSSSDVNIATVGRCYRSVVIYGKQLGIHRSRSAQSSIVMCTWNSDLFSCSTAPESGTGHRAARINYFLEHVATIHGESRSHLLVSLPWFRYHPKNMDFGKPVTVWYHDLFEPHGSHSLVPVQFIKSRAIALIDELDDESVQFVVPCGLDF